MNLIPFHSLVLCKTNTELESLPKHERISKEIVEFSIVGEKEKFRSSNIFLNEAIHRINLKLSLGERVGLYTGDLTPDEKNHITTIANNQGATTIPYDGSLKLATTFVRSEWNGITIVGDIHGDLQNLQKCLSWAKSRHHYLWFLGDIVDYGTETLQTVNIVHDLVMNGKASLIVGNHERKIAKWLEQKEQGTVYVRLSDGNKTTINALEKLSNFDRKKWICKYRALLSHASLIESIHNATFVHAAVHPSIWGATPNENAIEKYGLYGETVNKGVVFKRTYNWVDAIPKDQWVYVGHDVRHKYPMVKTGKAGGHAVFLDTGSGKGGTLSSADLKFDTNGIHMECFKQY